MRRILHSTARYVCLTLVCVAGCGPSAQSTSPEQIKSAQSGYEESLTAFQAKDYERAATLFTQALEAGGLNPDMIGDLFIKRALANAELGHFERAHDDLKLAGEGAPPDRTHAARAYVFKKQGEADKSKQSLAMARKFNPRIKIPN